MKHESNKKKIITSKWKKVFSIVAVIAVAISLALPVVAVNPQMPMPMVPTKYGTNYNGHGDIYIVTTSSVCNLYYLGDPYGTICMVSSEPFTVYYANDDQSYTWNSVAFGSSNYYEVTTYAHLIQSPYIGTYTGGFADAVSQYENDPPTTPPSPSPAPEPSELNYTLPAGNVAYIRIDPNTFDGFTLRCTMPINSEMFGTAGTLESKWSTTQHWGFSSSLPSQGDNLSQYGSMISWQVDTSMGTNLFQQSQNAIYNPVGPFLAQDYLVVVNPLYYGVQANNSGSTSQTINNGSIKICVDSAIDIKVFKLTQSVTINNNTASYNTDVSSDPYTGEIDPETGDIIWTDPSGGTSSPDLGGGNVVNDSNVGFMSWISELVQSVINVFTPAHQAIMTLAQAVQNFASYMYALYVWLPAPILNLLTAAISLAIIIGVVKVFI